MHGGGLSLVMSVQSLVLPRTLSNAESAVFSFQSVAGKAIRGIACSLHSASNINEFGIDYERVHWSEARGNVVV